MINEKAIYEYVANFIWSMYLLIMVDTLLLRTSLHFTQLQFSPLHYTCRHFTSSHLNFTQLHSTTLSFGLTPFKFPTAPFHLTSLHWTFRRFSPHFCSFHFIPFIIFLNSVYKNFRFRREVPNVSAVIWFQFLMILFKKRMLPDIRSLLGACGSVVVKVLRY